MSVIGEQIFCTKQHQQKKVNISVCESQSSGVTCSMNTAIYLIGHRSQVVKTKATMEFEGNCVYTGIIDIRTRARE